MKLTKPSLLGAFAGCLLTTVGYVLVSSGLTLMWNGFPGEDTEYSEVIVENQSPLRELRSGILNKLHNRITTSYSNFTAVNAAANRHYSRTNSLFPKKEVLLSVLATSTIHVQDSFYLVNSTWGENAYGWKIALGTSNWTNKVPFDGQNTFFSAECGDFLSRKPYLTPKQLFCLLKGVYNKYIFQYEWFLIATDSIYVAINYLGRQLQKLDSTDIVYTGKPDRNQFCAGGPGIVLSQAALKRIVPYLQSCLESGNRSLEVNGDKLLGTCFKNKLQKTCRKLDKSKLLFVEDTQRLSSNSDWINHNKHFATVYPIQSVDHMNSLLLLDHVRELTYHRLKIKHYRDQLHKSSFCRSQHVKSRIKTPQPSREIKGWSVVNPNSTYYLHRLEPRDWYEGELKKEMEMVAKDGLELVNKRNSTDLRYHRLLYGFFRNLGVRGRELMLDVEAFNGKKKTVERMHLVRPYYAQPMVLEDAGPEAINKTIDFIVPLSNVRTRFTEFMKIYEDLCLKVDEKCRLNLVVYGDHDFQVIQTNLTLYKTKYPNAQFKIIPGKGQFSRGRALHIGISSLQPSDLAFTCDVDMTIERSFLNRCRRNVIQGRRVYYPEVFKYYNMDYVYHFRPKPKYGYDISRNHGHWCTYGYGMLCIYKSDYDTVGGYNTTIEGWGGEDVRLVDSVVERGFEVMRAPDPSLLHRYHPKICSKSLTKGQYSQCVSSRNEDIADRRRLADYIYYLENKCKVKKKVWD